MSFCRSVCDRTDQASDGSTRDVSALFRGGVGYCVRPPDGRLQGASRTRVPYETVGARLDPRRPARRETSSRLSKEATR